jgi:hypothetical protein
MHRERLPYFLIPIAAFVAIIPLLINGCSCGHDFDFHIVSWMEAARQFTHGTLHPHWAYTPAWNAGEPRFVFYPPLSWTIGAILGLIFPWTWTPILYTWLALTAAGLAAYYLARDFATPVAATLAAILYTVNPYMLFTAYERTAYAELLAAAWIPLLLHAILRNKVTIPRIAIPIALLWLTNAPAAVMSCYALALLTIIRLAINPATTNSRTTNRDTTDPGATNPGAPPSASSLRLRWASRQSATALAHANTINASSQTRLQLAISTAAGTALGLGLAAFYILPAAYERRYVQIAMAILPGMRIQDNFLFHHTSDILHDQVLHTASLIAVILITLTIAALLFLRATKPGAPYLDSEMWASRASTTAPAHPTPRRVPHPSRSHREGWDEQPSTGPLLGSLAILTVTIALLLFPLTSFIWNHAPELVFLQFPWRLLAILAAVLCLATAMAITPLKLKPTSTTILAIAIAAILTYPSYHLFHQACDPEDTVAARLTLFHSNQGTDPTDEYTPNTADNDSLAQINPPYWLSSDPDAKAPANTPAGPTPTHLTLTSPNSEDLIVNLRDYPAWQIALNGTPIATRIQRNDGLIAIPLSAGPSTIDITYTQTVDQTIGDIISLSSIALLSAFAFRNQLQLHLPF